MQRNTKEMHSRRENDTVVSLVAGLNVKTIKTLKLCSDDTAVGAFDLQCGRRGQARAGSSPHAV